MSLLHNLDRATIAVRDFSNEIPFSRSLQSCHWLTLQQKKKAQRMLNQRLYNRLRCHPQTVGRYKGRDLGVFTYLVELDMAKKEWLFSEQARIEAEKKRNYSRR